MSLDGNAGNAFLGDDFGKQGFGNDLDDTNHSGMHFCILLFNLAGKFNGQKTEFYFWSNLGLKNEMVEKSMFWSKITVQFFISGPKMDPVPKYHHFETLAKNRKKSSQN